jgi:two-component system, chemotaxis family, protein-glutamate methylesterase/glutaminase
MGMSDQIRLLVVDDSVFVRMAVRAMVDANPEIEIVGEAVDGAQAVKMAADLAPDVITMDIAMPVLDGLEATRQIMAASPTPIIMLSSLTEKGVATTFQALELGAVDYVPKSASAIDIDFATLADHIAAKVRFWAHRKPSASAAAGAKLAATIPPETDLLVIAAGPSSAPLAGELLQGVAALPFPTLMVQEMPANFTAPFAHYLNRTSSLPVHEGTHGSSLTAGAVTVMPGDCGGSLSRNDTTFTLNLDRAASSKPSDVVLAAAAAARAPLVVLLPGDFEETLARLKSSWGGHGGAIWMAPAAGSKSLAEASTTTPPVVVLDYGLLVATLRQSSNRAAA